MSNYVFKTEIPQAEYDAFVKNHPYCNLLQSYDWAKIKSGWKHMHTGVYEDGKLVATALMLMRPIKLGYSMGYLPRGPIMDYKNQELLEFFLDALKKEAKKNKVLFIKLDPAIHVNDYKSSEYNENRYEDTQSYLKGFEKAGAKHTGFVMDIKDSIQPRFQANKYNEEGFEENLPKHTRRLIKDADKRNVQIIHGHNELLSDFARLVELTEGRKGVALRDYDYFKLLMDTYDEDAVIFLAKVDVKALIEQTHMRLEQIERDMASTPENAKKKLHRLQEQQASAKKELDLYEALPQEAKTAEEGTSIAGILSVQYGDTCEMLYAGMDERFKKFMPQYKEYVENFKWAYERGCRFANMGGVEGSLDDGLTKFKDNFDPTINEFIGEFDLMVNPLLGPIALKAYNYLKSR
jgi:serine/alanine adding enzyme